MFKKITISFIIILSIGFNNLAQASTLSDISGHKNKMAIDYLISHDIVSGYLDGTFKPDKSINRAELLKILVRAKGIVDDLDDYKNCFPDVKDDWFSPYVCYAKIEGWVEGYPDGNFKPSKTVNKVEAIKMLINSQNFDVLLAVSGELFDDVQSNQWFAPYVKSAKDKGLLEEVDGNFNPSNEMTRAGVSENIYRSMIVKEYELNSFFEYQEDPLNFSIEYLENLDEEDQFPINLLENDQWEISLRKIDEQARVSNTAYKIKRTLIRYPLVKDDLALVLVTTDPKTGSVSERAKDNLMFITLGDDYLTLMFDEGCRYEAIREGCHKYKLEIPISIPEKKLVVKETYSGDTNGSTFDKDFLVEVLGKNATEKPCNIKGIKHSPYNVYYTSDSEHFDDWFSSFVCFETEQEAEKLNYKKALDN